MEKTTLRRTHPWEKAGLGIAPFRFVGSETKTYQACPGAPIQVGGSCDACGNGIKHFCWIEDANGKRFKVGSVCVNKVDRKLGKVADAAVKAADKAATAERENARIAATIEILEREELSGPILRAEIASHPHPNAWRAEQGDTRLDYFRWMFSNAGHSGSMKIVRAIDKTIKRLGI